MQLGNLLAIAVTVSLVPSGVLAAKPGRGRSDYLRVSDQDRILQIERAKQALAKPPCRVMIHGPVPKGKKIRTDLGRADAEPSSQVTVTVESNGATATYQCEVDATCEKATCENLPSGWTCDSVNMHHFPKLTLEALGVKIEDLSKPEFVHSPAQPAGHEP
ncbi:uncharacterized protein PpBr36_10732 [Pyricularia pennisetigena]|uniref:uncharacterized protein n=1 Tax=Pyricularia pennisetigena TaxID=1578925 RepID=UPI0011511EA0|nr:uncharacterized protein PpBr36_10732 [Pyricularia pennisetigena]TLS20925.1 hypothetical protein PpBr36_10732 [Pyricularia pennisetigena]